MRKGNGVDLVRVLAVAVVACCMAFAGTAAAVSSDPPASSPNYMISEPQFGTGSSVGDCSENYCANTSAGDTAAGLMESRSFHVLAGGTTTDEPLIEVATSGGIANLGTLDPSRTATFTMAVSVRTYQTGGYVIQIAGDPPGYGAHQLARLEEPTASRPGVEQFGLNLVANKEPAIGADPVQVPNNRISFGKVAANYGMSDKFMYKDGDIVAYSDVDSGRTDYTVSMILNISNATPKGWYISVFSAVVVPVY